MSNRFRTWACALAAVLATFSFVPVAGAADGDTADVAAGRKHSVRSAHAQVDIVSPAASSPAPMRYYGGPKSPMWPAAR